MREKQPAGAAVTSSSLIICSTNNILHMENGEKMFKP